MLPIDRLLVCRFIIGYEVANQRPGDGYLRVRESMAATMIR